MALDLSITRTFNSREIQYNWGDSRKYLRYDDNSGQLIDIDLAPDQNNNSKSIKGLVVDTSFGGCGMVITTKESLLPGQVCQIHFDRLGPVKARIIWKKEVSETVFRVGCQYIWEA